MSSDFHTSDSTDQSRALQVCHRCATPAHSKCYRAAVTSEIDHFDKVGGKKKVNKYKETEEGEQKVSSCKKNCLEISVFSLGEF